MAKNKGAADKSANKKQSPIKGNPKKVAAKENSASMKQSPIKGNKK